MSFSDFTEKQKLFVLEYLTDRNATRSAIAAGYSEHTAYSIGHELLKNPEIAAEIERRTKKLADKLELTPEKVLREICKLAFLDPRKFYNEDGSLKAITDLDDDTAAALAGLEIEEAYEHFGKGQAKPTGTIKKIKFADKGLNLERLGRHLKLFTDMLEVSGMDQIADQLAKARARMSE